MGHLAVGSLCGAARAIRLVGVLALTAVASCAVPPDATRTTPTGSLPAPTSQACAPPLGSAGGGPSSQRIPSRQQNAAWEKAWSYVIEEPDAFAGVGTDDRGDAILVIAPGGPVSGPAGYRGLIARGPRSYSDLKKLETAVAREAVSVAPELFALAQGEARSGRVVVVLRACGPAAVRALTRKYGKDVDIHVDPRIGRVTAAAHPSR